MNDAVLTKIEYRLTNNGAFLEIETIPFSGKLVEKIEEKKSGDIRIIKIDFSVARSCAENDAIIIPLSERRAQYRVTDANGTVYLIGDSDFEAKKLRYERVIEGAPGSFGGYRCMIEHISPSGPTVQ